MSGGWKPVDRFGWLIVSVIAVSLCGALAQVVSGVARLMEMLTR